MNTTIDPKPAAGLLGGTLATLTIGVLNRYTSFHPSIEEASSLVTVFSFGLAWIVPSTWWRRAEGASSPAPAPPAA